LENEYSQYTKEAHELEKVSVAFKFVENAHNKAIKEIDANLTAKKRFSNLKNELYMTKQKLKEAQDELKTEENKVNIEHKEIIALEER